MPASNELHLSKALARAESMLTALLAVSEDAIIIRDSQSQIVAFNPAAERMFGYTSSEVLGKRIGMLVPEHRQTQASSQTEALLNTPGDVIMPLLDNPRLLRRKNGQEFIAEVGRAKLDVEGDALLITRLRDVSDKSHLVTALETTQAVVNISEDAILCVDEDRNITLFNPAAERMFDLLSNEVLGSPVDRFIPPGRSEPFLDFFNDFATSNKSFLGETETSPVVMQRSTGEEFPAEVSLGKFENHGKVFVVASLRDVTERLRAEKLRIQLRTAEETMEIKSRLLGTVAHELRSPLAAILGFTTLLIEYNDRLETNERLGQLHVIEDSTRHLQRIVDDLLLLSRLEAGVLEIQHEPVSLNVLFDAVIKSFGPASARRFKIAPKRTRLAVIGDQARLRQVLTNLIDNALKYSPEGSDIEIQARRAHNKINITVRDRGPGIQPEETELIFESFYRGGNANVSDELKSAGLGLAICKGFVEAHGGEIKAELPEDGGLAITFTLPLANPKH